MRDAENAVIREKFIALNAYIRKERSKINNISFHLRKLEKEEQIKFQMTRSKQIKIKAENKNKKSIKKINETKICFFEMINKINKPLTRLRKK